MSGFGGTRNFAYRFLHQAFDLVLYTGGTERIGWNTRKEKQERKTHGRETDWGEDYITSL